MIQFLSIFEHRIETLQSPWLLMLAVITCAVGLFVWLGGLGFKKTMFVIAGAYYGAACTVFIHGSNLLLLAAFVGIGALLALKLQDTFLVLIASIFAAVYGFSSLIIPYVSTKGELISIIRQIAIGIPYYNWPILLVLIVAPLAISSTFPKGASAVFHSAAGAGIILAAAVMMLVRSDIVAAGHISSKRELYLALFAATTALGTVTQLYLLPKLGFFIDAAERVVMARTRRTKKAKKDEAKAFPAQKTSAWRTS